MARPMSITTAASRIKSFLKRYRGKSILFASLNDQDKHSYVLVKQYQYFRKFLSREEALQRAINNANAHRKNGYAIFDNYTEHIIIGK